MLLGASSEVTLEWTGVGNDWKKELRGASENILFLDLGPENPGLQSLPHGQADSSPLVPPAKPQDTAVFIVKIHHAIIRYCSVCVLYTSTKDERNNNHKGWVDAYIKFLWDNILALHQHSQATFFFKDHGLGCPLWQLTYRAQSEKHSEAAENPTSAAHLPPPHFVCRQERDLLANWY